MTTLRNLLSTVVLVRSTSAGFAVLILGGAAFFWWQRSQIVTLREQVYALEASQKRLADPSPFLMAAGDPRIGGSVAQAFRVGASRSRRSDDSAVLRADERRLILSQYRDVLAEVKLPPATAAHLEDLLMERIEVVLDAEDAAVREGASSGGSGRDGGAGRHPRDRGSQLGNSGACRNRRRASPQLAFRPTLARSRLSAPNPQLQRTWST